MDKQHIIVEIKRTAADNGGLPLGRGKFLTETGIKKTDWYGRYWARWGDALREAGFQPNPKQAAYNDDLLIEKYVGLVRELGRFPVDGEIKLRARIEPTFPSHTTFARFGSKRQLAARILEYCDMRGGHEDVVALCISGALPLIEPNLSTNGTEKSGIPSASTKDGYVYMGLLKLGREKRYKIGKAVLVERRTDQLSIQLPEDLELIHAIRTDAAYGIEEYWHKRFASKNTAQPLAATKARVARVPRHVSFRLDQATGRGTANNAKNANGALARPGGQT